MRPRPKSSRTSGSQVPLVRDLVNRPLERVEKETKRLSHVVGIFLDTAAVIRLVGAVLIDVHDVMSDFDPWTIQRAVAGRAWRQKTVAVALSAQVPLPLYLSSCSA